MRKELTSSQSFIFLIYIGYIGLRGGGFTWFFSLFFKDNGSWTLFVSILNNDMVAFIVTIIMAFFLIVIEKNKGITRTIVTRLFGKRIKE